MINDACIIMIDVVIEFSLFVDNKVAEVCHSLVALCSVTVLIIRLHRC